MFFISKLEFNTKNPYPREIEKETMAYASEMINEILLPVTYEI